MDRKHIASEYKQIDNWTYLQMMLEDCVEYPQYRELYLQELKVFLESCIKDSRNLDLYGVILSREISASIGPYLVTINMDKRMDEVEEGLMSPAYFELQVFIMENSSSILLHQQSIIGHEHYDSIDQILSNGKNAEFCDLASRYLPELYNEFLEQLLSKRPKWTSAF